MSIGRASRRDLLKGGLALVAGSLAAEACGGGPAADKPDGALPLPDADLAAPLDAEVVAGEDAGPPDAAEAADAAVEAPDASGADAGAVLAPRPTTTRRWRIQGVLPSEKQPDSLKRYWGVTRRIPGDEHLRINLLDADPTAGAPTGAAASMLYLAHLTDVHVIDEESPARTINLDQVAGAAWRAQEAHSVQVLDAMVRKLNALNAVRPMDLLLVTGDLVDNNQKNELGWFLKVLEGGPLQPNSGLLEDPTPGPDNDPHDGMIAAGLGPIPWYVALGNHDLLIQGNLPRGPIVNYSPITGDPTRSVVGPHDLGRANPPACNPIPPGESLSPPRCIPTPPGLLTGGTIPADANRVNLSANNLRAMVASAPGLPAGHGFAETLASTANGDYVVEPVPGLPLRLIVLNTVAGTGAQGELAQATIDGFLATALLQAEADQVLVVVASHHPSDSISSTGAALRARLNACPNVILHLVGHTHQNLVTPRPGTTAQDGYWEVTTAGLAEWPQQARLIELVDCRNGTAEIWLTLIDYDSDPVPLGAVVEGSRFLALREVQSGARGSGTASEGRAIDRNVILPVALTPELRARLDAVAGRPIESMLFA